LAHKLLDAIDPATIEREAAARHVTQEAAAEALKEEACRPFDNPGLRRLLKDIKRQTEIRIDTISTDAVISSGYDAARAHDTVERFRQFLAEYRDTLVALQILYARAHATRRLDRAVIEECATRCAARPGCWSRSTSGAPTNASATTAGRFNLWLGREERAGRTYTEVQHAWLFAIRDFIAVNVDITPEDLMDAPDFAAQGGLVRAHTLFGDRLRPILDEPPQALIA
jgi:type I restriction enzyme R subunit